MSLWVIFTRKGLQCLTLMELAEPLPFHKRGIAKFPSPPPPIDQGTPEGVYVPPSQSSRLLHTRGNVCLREQFSDVGVQLLRISAFESVCTCQRVHQYLTETV